MEDAPKLLKIRKSLCPDIWIRLPRHKWPKSWSSMEDPVIPLERNLYGHPLAGLLWERQFEKILLQVRLGEGFQLGMLIRTPWKRVILICVCGWHKIGWKETKHWSDVESTQQRSWFGRTNIFPASCIPGMYSKTMWNKQRYCWQLQNHVWIQNFRRSNWKMTMLGKSEYFFVVLDMEGRAKKCVERYCVLANRMTKQLCKVWIPCIDDHPSFQKKKNWNPWENCQKYALKLFWSAYTWHVLEDPIFYGQWTNLHDRSQNGPKLVTNDYVVWSPTFITHVNTNSIVVWVILQKQCRLGLFQDSDFAGDLEDSKSSSGGTLCVLGSHTLLPISWMCTKQTSVSHSSTESEIILWMQDWGWMVSPHLIDGIWSSQFLETRIRVIKNREICWWTNVKFVQHLTLFKNESNLMEWSMIWTMLILFHQTSTLLIRKLCCMCLKTTKQWSRWLHREKARQWDMFPEPTELLLIGYSIESIWTPKFKSNTLTPKTNSQTYWPREISTRDEWNHLLCLFNISHFWSTNCSEVMSKRTQKDSGEERVKAKSKRMMNLVSRCSERTPDMLAFTASESPGKTRHESQLPLSTWIEQHQRTGRPVLDAYSSSYSVECGQELVFSKVEIWWIDGSKNRETCLWTTTCFIRRAHGQFLLLMTMICTLTPSQNQKSR